ncbi:MAG: class I SAM-dependent methyltransferase [Gemmatimonadales bacterium]
MRTFVRADGRSLQVVPGFRDQVLAARPSVTPRPDWTEAQYAAAAVRKHQRAARLIADIARWRGSLDGAEVLDVGCGDGVNCLCIALHPVKRVVGIDLELPLLELDGKGAQTRRLAGRVLEQLDHGGGLDEVLHRRPVSFVAMDATSLALRDDSIDVLLTRSALEHVAPIERAVTDMARVVRPGGLIHLRIDPFFWVRGCHKRGLVDIPWAHARLSLADFRRFVTDSEGETAATARTRRLETLNRLTLVQWRAVVAAGPFELAEWREEPAALALTLLQEHPDVRDTLLRGVEERDLVHGRIEAWLRVSKP